MNHANEQQIVLVTGAPGALGRLGKTFSKSIVASDAKVFLVDLDIEQARQLVGELGPQQADFLVADITTVSGIQKAIQAYLGRFGKVDAVVHAAYPRSAGWWSTLE